MSIEDSMWADDLEGNIRRITVHVMKALEFEGYESDSEVVREKVEQLLEDLKSVR